MAVVVGVVGGVHSVEQASAAPILVTDADTAVTTSPPTSSPGVTGRGNSEFKPSKTYTLSYDGKSEVLTSFVAAGREFTANGSNPGRVEVRRSGGDDAVIVWQFGDTNPTKANVVSLSGTPANDLKTTFAAPSLTRGLDNVFANREDYNNNFSNVERVDVLFDAGLSVDALLSFAVFDRGKRGEHDGFKIAAVTGLSPDGLPSEYGLVQTLISGKWGDAPVNATRSTAVLRQDDPNAAFRPTVVLDQEVGGVAIAGTSLAPLGTTIYGYSLFAPDVNGVGDALLDWTNAAVYSPMTSGLTANPLGGGLDLAAASAFAYTAVPEPGIAAAFFAASATVLLRRRRAR